MVEADPYQKFERRLSLKSKSTEKNYRSGFKKFLKYTGLTSEKIVSLMHNDPEEVEFQILKVQKDMTENGYKATTAALVYKAVRFFLKANGFRGFSIDREDRPRMVYNGSAKVSKTMIAEMYDKVGAQFRERNRALLMLAKDSGLRISDLSKLNVEDYQVASKREGGFRFFRPLETTKTGDYAHILIGPEAVDAIETWLDVRGRDPGPLFISLKGDRLGPKAIAEVFRKFKTRRMDSGDFSQISAHSFRKFRTNNTSIKETWNRWLIGKALGPYHEEPPVEEIIKAYIERYREELAIFGTPESTETKKKIEALEDQLDETRGLVNRLNEVIRMEGTKTREARSSANFYQELLKLERMDPEERTRYLESKMLVQVDMSEVVDVSTAEYFAEGLKRAEKALKDRSRNGP